MFLRKFLSTSTQKWVTNTKTIAPRNFFSSSNSGELTRAVSDDIIGIDLGTTNSCVAISNRSGVTVIENSEGKRTTPSAIAFADDGFPFVGQAARNQAAVNPSNTFYATKRLIGKRYDDPDIQKESKSASYRIIQSEKGDAWVATKEGKKYSPSQLSAYILMKMKDTAESYVGKQINRAVITVPAYFNDQQRQATKDAGLIAGLTVERIINEPTAAALAYGLDKSGEKVIAVYDFGGGTFDISILHIGGGVFEVKATNGDTSCGGEDIDSIIQELLVKEFKDTKNIDIRNDKGAMQRVREAAERAKIDLSLSQVAEINLPYLAVNSNGPQHLSYKLARDRFEKETAAFIDRTLESCKKCIKDSGYQVSQIDEVLLVGGSTRIPYVQKIVKDLFGKQPNKSVNPDEAIAIGAAIQAGVLKGTIKDLVLLDLTPLSLGKSIVGNMMSVIIPRNTPVPCTKTKTYTTTKDCQMKIDVVVYQGEREVASMNKELGRFVLDGIPMAQKGVPKIDVTFNIDQNGILNVLAKEKGTGKTKAISIKHQGGLSSQEISDMIADAQKHKRYDEKRKKLTRLRLDSEALVQQIPEQLKLHGKNLDKHVVREIQAEVDALKVLIDKKLAFEDIKPIEEQLAKTKKQGFRIGESIYAAHQKKEQSAEE